MFTLFYAGATSLQSWRIKNVCSKIAELSQKSSVVFYALSGPLKDGYDVATASSDLCLNKRTASISSILWFNGKYRGCSLSPIQVLTISPWISFPKTPCLIPFACQTPICVQKPKKNNIYLLLETELEPCFGVENFIKIEEYGTPIAWKIDTNLAVILATDINYFTRFLIATFLRNQYCINDQLPLIRIESIQFDGSPQPYELLTSHLRNFSRSKEQLDNDDWKTHLKDLQSIGVLAHQAITNESGKNCVERTSPQSKPDLIPTEKDTNPPSTSNESEKQVKNDVEKLSSTQKVSKEVTPTNTTVQIVETPIKSKEQPVTNTSNDKSAATKSKLTPIPIETKQEGATKSKSIPSPIETKQEVATKSKSTPSPIETKKEVKKVEAAKTTNIPTETQVLRNKFAESKDFGGGEGDVVKTTPTATQVIPNKPIEQEGESGKGDGNSERSANRHNYSNSGSKGGKPLNILVYSDIASVKQSALSTLKELLAKDVYTMYPLTQQQLEQKYWLENTALVVVCGAVLPSIAEIIVDYFLRGGKVLSLCSDILHFILPNYRTAEVREHELVNFSYAKWRNVKMMHHIFCYQASPVKKNFSTDSEDSSHTHVSKSGLVCPRSLELKDLNGGLHGVQVDVLGTEEVWNTPSLLVAKSVTGGRVLFSQIHLEMQPNQFEADEIKFAILKQNDRIRLEIFADLLSKHLNIEIEKFNGNVVYQNAYFLGHHESKFELLQKLTAKYGESVIRTSKLTLQFCGKTDELLNASNETLPILMHSCPEDFSTVEYFENLKTKYIGRLVIYAPIVNSSMNVINEIELANGIAILVRQQTDGQGRSNNQWISPAGCTMFSLQIHIDLDSNLGRRLPLIQHLIATAMVNAIKSQEKYKGLDIGLKWPNDIYAYGTQKIGGLVVKTTLMGKIAVVNIGCGINLDNKRPTVCINDMIVQSNNANRTNTPPIKYEQFLAWIFNEIETLVERVQIENYDFLYKLYYQLWLHGNQAVQLRNSAGKDCTAKVIGIDDYGFLQVQLSTGAIETVQPDGNSFDMLKGLILPKQQ